MDEHHRHESSVSPHNAWIQRRAKSSIPYTNVAIMASKLVAQQMSAYVYHQMLQQQPDYHQLTTLDPNWTTHPGSKSLELCRYRLPKVTSVSATGPDFHPPPSMMLRRSSTSVAEGPRGRTSIGTSRSRRSTGDVTPTASESVLDKAAAGHMVARAIAGSASHERVILSESVSHPDVPIAHRNPDERNANPDRLSLDRRGLTVCPILEGEDNLRLLNYQHNLISRIQHLSSLRKLIFLDLYDNRIEAIAGLSSLKSLRVLMLGKNRISKIEGLDALVKLDVLDLHGNDISDLTNISHLCELRVLNLAGNQLTGVRGLRGLNALTELNLRRNRIRVVEDVDMLPYLQRLFLSFNDISSWQSIACLADATSIVELSLDGNPLSREASYKPTVIRNMPQMKQLDMKRISEEERRMAAAMARKDEDRRRETSKTAALKMEFLFKEKRRLAITNARRQWESMQASLLARGTVPSGFSRTGRNPPELYATHVTTVCLPRPQSAGISQDDRRVREEVSYAGDVTPSREKRRPSSALTSADEEEVSRPRSGRCSRPGSARAMMAIATVTALPSGIERCSEQTPAGDSPSTTTQDSGFESSSKTTSVCDTEESTPVPEPRILSESQDSVLSPPGAGVPTCHLAEVQGGDQLHLYASGSLEALDRQWGLQAAGQISTVRFSFVDFEEIAQHLHKLRARFPAVHSLIFHSTNLHSLAQISALANVRKLESISVEPEGNPVTQFTLLRPFLLYRLSHLGLKRVNGEEVRPAEILSAERLFAPLAHMTTSQLTQAHLLSLLTDAKRRQQQQQAMTGNLIPATIDLSVGKLGLVYAGGESKENRQQASEAKTKVAHALLGNIVKESVSMEDNREVMARTWPKLLREVVANAVSDCLAAGGGSSGPSVGIPGVKRDDSSLRRT